jgi:hypothetical protein
MSWKMKKGGHYESELKALVKESAPFSSHANGINVFVIVLETIPLEVYICDVSPK